MRKILIALIMIMTAAALAACAGQSPDAEKTDSAAVMEEFYTVIAREDAGIKDVADFIEANIESVSENDASEMLLKYEELQQDYISILENDFYNNDIQSKFAEAFNAGAADLNDTEQITDDTIKNLVNDIKEIGYKVEQAEATFFPIIDYSFYNELSSYATADISEYIKIMTAESDAMPLKDAAVVISWDEVVSRAIVQEKFLRTYDDSSKAEDVRFLYEKYKYIALYGSDNTPVLDSHSKKFDSEAKAAYEQSIKNNTDSEFVDMLRGFVDVLADNGYELTEEVEQYRESVL